MSKTMTQGIITLIYKNKGERDYLKNWRPISLLNNDYKILSKILAERVKKGMREIITQNKTCGGNGKDIQQHVLSIRTILDYIKETEQMGAMVLIDQEKAFDRLEHNFIQQVLEKFGFGNNFQNWTKILYTGITSRAQVNGAKTGEFEINRSVRQGCPLSVLFIIRNSNRGTKQKNHE